MRDNDWLFFETSTDRSPWGGDPRVERELRIVIRRRVIIKFVLNTPMRVNR